jgi:hypothetical protein
MATQVQWRGGSTAEHATFTGAAREVTVDTQKQTLVVHNGSTVGGEALLREDQANLPGSVTNGIYTPGEDQVAVATNGVGRLFVNSAGLAGLGTSSPGALLHVTRTNSGVDSQTVVIQNQADASHTTASIYFSTNTAGTGVERSAAIKAICPASSSTANDLAFYTNVSGNAPSEQMRIDSIGRLLVGTSSSSAPTAAVFQGNSNSASGSGLIYLQNGSAASSISPGTEVGRFRFADNAGGLYAEIMAVADAAGGTGDYPGRLVFSTTADGASSSVERMRIKASGVINFSNAPVYADNAAALAGGLVAGDVYRKADGTLMITF